jgi:hypothetical protein
MTISMLTASTRCPAQCSKRCIQLVGDLLRGPLNDAEILFKEPGPPLSGVNLADSAMRVFEHPNTTAAPNGGFGIRCEIGAYIEGSLGSLGGRSGTKDVSDPSCIDRAIP